MIAAVALATGGLSIVATSANAAEVLTVCATDCAYTSIQAAVTAAAVGDTVSVAAGNYQESVTVSKGITIVGAGSGTDPASATVLSGTTGNGLALSGTDGSPVVVKDLRVTGFANGIAAGSYVTLTNVSSSGNTNYGINLNSGTTNLSIAGSSFENNKVGLKLGSGASASNITVTGSSFNNNTLQGWYSDNNTSGSQLTDVSITDSSFNGNPDKGFYTEKLSNATFTNVTFNNSGNGRAQQGAGLDLNLKYANFTNITLNNVVAIDSGTALTPNGSGISISARNDGSYATNPATLTGLTVNGGKVSGSVTGIYLGFGIQPTVSLSHLDLSGNGLAIKNETPAAVTATHNWWGTAAPDFAALASGAVTTAPWYGSAEMTSLAIVTTPGENVVVLPAEGAIVVTIAEGTEQPRLDVSALQGEGGEFTVADGMAVTNSVGASVQFAPGTTATPSDPAWGDEFIALQAVPLTTVTAPGGLAGTVVTAIKLGSDKVSFTLDKAVRILLPGAAGTSAGFIAPGGVLTSIATKCATDSQEAGDAVASDCYIAVGNDLVLWTKHFTTFAAYNVALAKTGEDSSPQWILGSGMLLLGVVAVGFAARRRQPAAR